MPQGAESSEVFRYADDVNVVRALWDRANNLWEIVDKLVRSKDSGRYAERAFKSAKEFQNQILGLYKEVRQHSDLEEALDELSNHAIEFEEKILENLVFAIEELGFWSEELNAANTRSAVDLRDIAWIKEEIAAAKEGVMKAKQVFAQMHERYCFEKELIEEILHSVERKIDELKKVDRSRN